MEQSKGLKNFTVNIKPTMAKIKDGKKLTNSELQSILEFYLEVVDYISNVQKAAFCPLLRG